MNPYATITVVELDKNAYRATLHDSNPLQQTVGITAYDALNRLFKRLNNTELEKVLRVQEERQQETVEL